MTKKLFGSLFIVFLLVGIYNWWQDANHLWDKLAVVAPDLRVSATLGCLYVVLFLIYIVWKVAERTFDL